MDIPDTEFTQSEDIPDSGRHALEGNGFDERAREVRAGVGKALRRPLNSPTELGDAMEDLLVAARKQHPLGAPRSSEPGFRNYRPLANVTGPNATWCVDFKGHFRTQDGND